VPFVRASVERQLSTVLEAWQRSMARADDDADQAGEGAIEDDGATSPA
jgi:hypothetical protein